jgi:hypothetical protein
VDSQVESVASGTNAAAPGVELIRFTVKAQIAGPPDAKAAPANPR